VNELILIMRYRLNTVTQHQHTKYIIVIGEVHMKTNQLNEHQPLHYDYR
jgi:hypothetical protein